MRSMINGGDPVIVASAHSGLTAKLVEKNNFDAIWASGFEISAIHGLPDDGELTMTEMLNVVRQMVDSVDIPVLVDCDEGYGNVNNVRRMVRVFERCGLSGVCIEDNLFPKVHSFWVEKHISLASMEDHGRKIKVAVDTKKSDDFIVIARTEALIRDLGMDEAIRRGEYYADCGADMVLIHSRARTLEEAREITRRWDREIPLVIVPTKFPMATNQELFEMGFKMIIWANHTLRLALKAVDEGLAELKSKGNAQDIEDRLGSLEDIYSLTGAEGAKAVSRI